MSLIPPLAIWRMLTFSLAEAPRHAPFQWWPKTECHCEGSGLIPQHIYSNTTITLSDVVSDFDTSVKQKNADYTTVHTSDGGITWHIETISITKSWCSNPTCGSPLGGDPSTAGNWTNPNRLPHNNTGNPAQNKSIWWEADPVAPAAGQLNPALRSHPILRSFTGTGS
ncbi:MAG: hypothetical protein M1828_001776 [Chrysothrix sp. TS-e1954]|nr:MAG: hypothetical protein M1828_001776 [Chrysothrix sp. TS-e1954]